MPDWLSLIIMAMATWRLAIMITQEEGPFDVFKHIRSAVGIKHADDGSIIRVPEKTVAKLLSCLGCMSVSMAVLVYVVWQFEPIPIWILAISSGAILIDRIRE